LLRGFGFAPTSFVRLEPFCREDFAVLTDFVDNATPLTHDQLVSPSTTLSRNAACAYSSQQFGISQVGV
jgi:hypothetical protein